VPGGSLGDALRNLERYVQQESFDNQEGGGGAFGPSIQFDTKGVEFGPWIRRFIAQIKRNWFIPYAAMSFKGHVVITFNVHKSGALSDLSVIQPSGVDAFNNSAFNALAASNPTEPLPPEYPSDKAFFTVTFYFNETPPTGQ
jgi:TonB family protein